MKLTPAGPVDGKKFAGKTVWFISPDESIPYESAQAAGMQAAGKSLGINVMVFDGKSNPSLFNQGFSTAIAQHAAGIMLGSIDPKLVSGPLAQARAQHIPVIDTLVGLPGQAETPGIYITLRSPTPQIGRDMADYALAASSCKTDPYIITTSVYPFDTYLTQGAKSEFAALCPSCKVTVDSIDPSRTATTVGSLVSNRLRQNPNINYLLPAYTALIPYMLPAEQQLSKTLPIISAAAVGQDFDQIRKGVTVGNAALPPPEYFGYLSFDAILRAMSGAPKPNGTLPIQLIDKKNIGTSDSIQSLFPGVANYASVYQKLWGAG